MRTTVELQQRRSRIQSPSVEMNLGRKHKPDYWILVLCSLLLAIGLIVVYSISPALSASNHISSSYYTTKQLLAICLSFVAFTVTAQVPLARWRQAYKPLLIVAAVATFLALLMPVNPAYPAHRWVRLGSFSFQSVELLKFAVLIWLAGFLSNRIRTNTITNNRHTLRPLLIALVVIGVIIAGVQSDLGSTGVLVAIMGTMAFVAGLPLKRILIICCVISIGLVLAISSSPYRRARLETYLHPTSNCQSSGYQACQALIAVGSGGMVGDGNSVQAYGYLPEAANDSIFAIYAEKFGFIGSIILIGIFIIFFNRMKRVAERIDDDFSRLLAVGILAWLSVQSIINIGAMLGLLPLKGITLPFISYGGTSVVFAAAGVGLIFQISRYTAYAPPRISKESKKGNTHDDSRDGRRIRGAYHPGFGGRS